MYLQAIIRVVAPPPKKGSEEAKQEEREDREDEEDALEGEDEDGEGQEVEDPEGNDNDEALADSDEDESTSEGIKQTILDDFEDATEARQVRRYFASLTAHTYSHKSRWRVKQCADWAGWQGRSITMSNFARP